MIAIGQNIEVTQFYGTPTKTFAVALGCDVRHAESNRLFAWNQDRSVTGDADR
jgi:predicted transcriptional regulator